MNLTMKQSLTVLSKRACLTLKQAQSDKRSRRLQICLPQPASELRSSLGVCATPRCVTSFSSFCSPLFDFSKLVIQGLALSKKLSAIKYSSTLINCSPSPFGWGGENTTLNYSGPNQSYFWKQRWLRRACAAGSGVCVFLLQHLRYISSCCNYRHYAEVTECIFWPSSLMCGWKTSMRWLNCYRMLLTKTEY